MFLGETDWKLIAIDVKDPLAAQLNGTYATVTCTYLSTPVFVFAYLPLFACAL